MLPINGWNIENNIIIFCPICYQLQVPTWCLRSPSGIPPSFIVDNQWVKEIDIWLTSGGLCLTIKHTSVISWPVYSVSQTTAGLCNVEMNQRQNFVSPKNPPTLTPKNSVNLFQPLKRSTNVFLRGRGGFFWNFLKRMGLLITTPLRSWSTYKFGKHFFINILALVYGAGRNVQYVHFCTIFYFY